MKSWKTPTPEQVDRAIALLAHPEQRRYFFDRLENPRWLEPLEKKGFFRKPPAVATDEEKGTVRFSPWPESGYLARMVAHDPAKVLEIALRIETDNVRVLEDLVEAALAMPSEMAQRLAPKALTWIEGRYQFFFPEKLGELISHLAKGGQVDAALSVGQALLAVLPGQGAFAQARARFDAWHYERILQKNLPDLVAAAKVPPLGLLCDLLQAAVQLSRERGREEKPEDYSYIWRPAMEGERRRGFHEVRDLLISAVRDAAIQVVKEDGEMLASVVNELERWPSHIFQRITLHVLRVLPERATDLVEARLGSRALFEERGLEREYALLLRDRYNSLSADKQREILGWIEQGPDLDKFREGHKAWGGQSPSGEECQEYAERWRLKRLGWIRNSLPPEWNQRFDSLVQRLGEPADPAVVRSSEAVYVGSKSPLSDEELRAMNDDDLIAYLKSWAPSGEPLGPSTEGLGKQLKGVVSGQPERFAQLASRFKEIDPTYVRAVLDGLHDAIGKESYTWEPVLDLCAWVVVQPRSIEGRAVQKWDADPDWGSTRSVIARLLSAGLQQGSGEIPISLREKVWQVLEELANDPEPTPQYEREFGGTNMDLVTMSINTVRGEAMHAIMRYAFWVRRHIERTEGGEERLARGFAEMPEVREVLELHLDPAHEPSLAIRSVYGEWLPWLMLLDRGWASPNLGRILPAENGQRDFWDAAWEAYIVFCQPYDEVLDALQEEYARAVERIGTVPTEKRHHGDPDEHLAEHLMVFYWRGKLDLNEQGGLLQRFYEKASDSIRAHALEFMGRSLQNTEGAVEAEILERFRSLWQAWLAAACQAAGSASHDAELAALGWWFVSGKFDDSWALTQLTEALRIAHKSEPGHLVVERLVTIAEVMPRESVQCLALMIEGDKEGWEIYSWRDEIRAIVSKAVASEDHEAKRSARDLVNRLGARGHFEFRDTLPKEEAV